MIREVARRLLGRDSPWMRELRRCQDEVASVDPNPYYLAAYRKEEISYWMHIPRWMYEDSGKGEVRRCLDVGCAYGTLALYSKRLFGCEVCCTDFVDLFMSKALVRKHDLRFVANNIEIDPFPWEGTFDVIVFTEVLEHLNFHPLPTLKKLHGLLSEGGKLYLSTPDASQWGRVTKYYSSVDEMPEPRKGQPVVDDHVYVFSKEELFDLTGRAGFRFERFDYSRGVVHRHFNAVLVKSRPPSQEAGSRGAPPAAAAKP